MTAWLGQLFLHFLSLLFCQPIVKCVSVLLKITTKGKKHSSSLLTQLLSGKPFTGSVEFPDT